MTKREILKRINQINMELKNVRELAASSCEAEGYPSHGSNYDLRVECWSRPLLEELEELEEELEA